MYCHFQILLLLSVLWASCSKAEPHPNFRRLATGGGSMVPKKRGYEGFYVILSYHGYLNPLWSIDEHQKHITAHLKSVGDTGFFDVANEIHVSLSVPAANVEAVNPVTESIKALNPDIIVNATVGHFHEYNGIYAAWNRSKEVAGKGIHDASKILVGYMHAKGGGNQTPNPKHPDGRTGPNLMLTSVVIEDWNYIFDKFVANPLLKTAGIGSTCGSFAQFHNYWWARGSFINQIAEPIFSHNDRTVERHYYEFWLNGPVACHHPLNETLSMCAEKYEKLPLPVPPNCDAGIDDHSGHPVEEKMNNMKYAILCSSIMLAALDYEKFGN